MEIPHLHLIYSNNRMFVVSVTRSLRKIFWPQEVSGNLRCIIFLKAEGFVLFWHPEMITTEHYHIYVRPLILQFKNMCISFIEETLQSFLFSFFFGRGSKNIIMRYYFLGKGICTRVFSPHGNWFPFCFVGNSTSYTWIIIVRIK